MISVKLFRIALRYALLILFVHTQNSFAIRVDDPGDPRINRLLIGRWNDPPLNEQDTREWVLNSLGMEILWELKSRLIEEPDYGKADVFIWLIAFKYRQFESNLTAEQRADLLGTAINKVKSSRASQQRRDSDIQNLLLQLQGIHHPLVKQLAEENLDSKVEWTRLAAERLATSLGMPLKGGSPDSYPEAGSGAPGHKAPPPKGKTATQGAESPATNAAPVIFWITAILGTAAVLWALRKRFFGGRPSRR